MQGADSVFVHTGGADIQQKSHRSCAACRNRGVTDTTREATRVLTRCLRTREEQTYATRLTLTDIRTVSRSA